MIRVMLADDHAILRGGLKEILAAAEGFDLVAAASSGNELIDLLRHGRPDVVMTDMTMSGICGVDLISRIHSMYPDMPILVLSMLDEPQIASRAIKAGASGYITKDSDPNELIAALRKVAAGGKYIQPQLAERMLFDRGSEGAPHCALTDRERGVFDLLIMGKDANEIADALCISNKTVSTHKMNLLEKMKMQNTAELVRYAVQNGLIV